jgi:hypothetical protein
LKTKKLKCLNTKNLKLECLNIRNWNVWLLKTKMSEYWKLKIKMSKYWKLKTKMSKYEKLKIKIFEYWKLKAKMSEYWKLKFIFEMFRILNLVTMVGFQHLLWHVLTNDKSFTNLWEDNSLKCHFYQGAQFRDRVSKFTNIFPKL